MQVEECSKRLILGSGFKTADLVRESKRRFGLVVRLTANECHRIRSATYPSCLQPSDLYSPVLCYIASFARIHRQTKSLDHLVGFGPSRSSPLRPCALLPCGPLSRPEVRTSETRRLLSVVATTQ